MSKDIIKRKSTKPLFVLSKANKFALGGLSGVDNMTFNKKTKYATDISSQLNELSNIKATNATQGYEDLNSVIGISSNEDLLNNFSSYNQYDQSDINDYSIDTSRAAAKKAVKGKGIVGSSIGTGVGVGASIGSAFGPIGTAIGTVVGGIGGAIGGLFTRGSKIRNAQKENQKRQNILSQNVNEINADSEKARVRTSRELTNQIGNLSNRNMTGLLQNYAAYGGYFPSLNHYAGGGSIHIKPSKRGTFTAAATKHGKSVQAFASQVLSNKENYSPAMVKKANFAKNASKWHHQYGGELNTNIFDIGGNINSNVPNEYTHGSTFNNGVTVIGNGSTHENNPMGGVPISIGQNGQPNMVEEGEVKYKDYIFSNRLNPSTRELKDMGLKDNLTKYSFAKIAEKMNKEASERPNDNISKRGLEASLDKLKVLQESQKQSKGLSNNNSFAKGGKLLTNGLSSITPTLSGNLPTTLGTNFTTGAPKVGLFDKLGNLNAGSIGTGLLRLAPAIASGIGAFSKNTPKEFTPDYSSSELALKGSKPVSYTPIGNYMKYTPLDTQRDVNTLNNIAGANRASIAQASGGNKGQYIAGVLASDRMITDKLGDIRRSATESDLNQRMQVENFNRGTNMANSEMGLRASMFNSSQQAQLAAQAAQLRQQAFDSARALNYQEYLNSEAAKSANLTNFANNLGEIGKELATRKMINSNPASLYSSGFSGNIKYKK